MLIYCSFINIHVYIHYTCLVIIPGNGNTHRSCGTIFYSRFLHIFRCYMIKKKKRKNEFGPVGRFYFILLINL